MKRPLLWLIKGWQQTFSRALPRRCKFEPSCSAYGAEAIDRFGALRGSVLAVWRILRCNPFSHGGFDPVRGHFTLRGVGHVHPAEYHGEAQG